MSEEQFYEETRQTFRHLPASKICEIVKKTIENPQLASTEIKEDKFKEGMIRYLADYSIYEADRGNAQRAIQLCECTREISSKMKTKVAITAANKCESIVNAERKRLTREDKE